MLGSSYVEASACQRQSALTRMRRRSSPAITVLDSEIGAAVRRSRRITHAGQVERALLHADLHDAVKGIARSRSWQIGEQDGMRSHHT